MYVYPFNHRERNSHFRARTASEKSTAEVNTICHFIAVAALSFSFSYLSGSLLVKASPSIVSVLEALLCLDVGRCCSTRPKSETLRPLVMRGFLLGDSWVLGSHQTVGESFSSPRFNLGGATTTHLTFCSGESAFTSSTLVLAASKEAMASTASSLPAASQQQQPQNTELLLLLMLEQVWDRRPQNSPSIMLVGGQVASSRVLPHHEREIPGPKESEIRSLDWKVRFFLIELSLAFDIMKWWLFNLVFSKFAWQVPYKVCSTVMTSSQCNYSTHIQNGHHMNLHPSPDLFSPDQYHFMQYTLCRTADVRRRSQLLFSSLLYFMLYRSVLEHM